VRLTGHVAYISGRCRDRILVGKRERRRPLGRPGRRWEDSIKVSKNRMGVGWGSWIGLDNDKWRTLVTMVRNLRVPQNEGNFLTS